MMATHWFLVIGAVLVLMALVSSMLERLPLTGSMLYLAIGVGLGPHGVGAVRLDPIEHAGILERLSEIAVIISLFTAGLKLRLAGSDRRWRLPIRLATTTMVLTVMFVAAIGVSILGLSLGSALLLGAVLAPTDPVLASEVQVEDPHDHDRLRFALTGEAGLNDGTAFPFVMLALGVLGVHEIGAWGWRWLAVDVLWAVSAGLGVGVALGTLVGRSVVYLRREHGEAVGLDDFLALGLIALAYGGAVVVHAYGFLSVFAAGLALRRVERLASERAASLGHAEVQASPEELATHPDAAPAYMANEVLSFNERLERMAEVALVVLLGTLLSVEGLTETEGAVWVVVLLLLVVRPLAVWIGTRRERLPRLQATLVSWFGIRGIGSLYYLAFAINHGAPEHEARLLATTTLLVMATSIVVHGVSVTPLMRLYERRVRASKPSAG